MLSLQLSFNDKNRLLRDIHCSLILLLFLLSFLLSLHCLRIETNVILGSVHPTPEKFENAALFLQLGHTNPS